MTMNNAAAAEVAPVTDLAKVRQGHELRDEIDAALDLSPIEAVARLFVQLKTAVRPGDRVETDLYAYRSARDGDTFYILRDKTGRVLDQESAGGIDDGVSRVREMIAQFAATAPAGDGKKDPRPVAAMKSINSLLERQGRKPLISQIVRALPAENVLDAEAVNSDEHRLGIGDGYVLDMSRAVEFDHEEGCTLAVPGALPDWLARQSPHCPETRQAGLKASEFDHEPRYVRAEKDGPRARELFNRLADLNGEIDGHKAELRRLSQRAQAGEDVRAEESAVHAQIEAANAEFDDVRAQDDALWTLANPLNAECPEIEALIRVIMDGDEDMIELLWEVAGRALSGEQYPQKAFLFIGSGGSGKGTFLSLLEGAFRDYVVETDYRNYFSGKAAAPERVRALLGRLVVLNEIGNDAEIANDVLKRVTEVQSARNLNSNEVVTSTQNTVVITANNTFTLKRDGGVDRRLVVVPFGRVGVDEKTVRGEVEAAIKALQDTYGRNWQAHPVVKRYVVEQTINGYGRMVTGHRFDLGDDLIPSKVLDATEAFFDDADPIAAAVKDLFEITGNDEDKLTRTQAATQVLARLRVDDPGADLSQPEKTAVYRLIEDMGAVAQTTVRVGEQRGRGFTGIRLTDK